MDELLTKIIPLSLGAAVSPTVLGVILMLLGGKRAVARGLAFTVGVLTVLAGLTAVGLILTRNADTDATREAVTRAIDGTLGALLLIAALATIVRARTHTHTDEPKATADPKHQASISACFLLGLGLMLSNGSTILLYLPAMHAISASGVSGSDKAIAVAIAFLITSIPATAPLTARVAVPTASARLFERMHGFVSAHQRVITITIEVVLGVFLLTKAA